jgi:hypothetical protein
LRHALSHQTGVPQTPVGYTPDWLADWDKMCRGIADLTPLFPIGQRTAYHSLNYGHINGEILRRVGTRSAVDGQENPQPRRRGHSAIETTHLVSVWLCLAEAPLRRQPQRASTERPRRIGRLYPDLLRQVVGEADHELSRALRRRRRPHRPQRHDPATPKQDHDSEEHAAQG